MAHCPFGIRIPDACPRIQHANVTIPLFCCETRHLYVDRDLYLARTVNVHMSLLNKSCLCSHAARANPSFKSWPNFALCNKGCIGKTGWTIQLYRGSGSNSVVARLTNFLLLCSEKVILNTDDNLKFEMQRKSEKNRLQYFPYIFQWTFLFLAGIYI